MELNGCHKHLGELFRCDVQKECEAGGITAKCANTIFTSGIIPKQNIRDLKEDCFEQGYALIPVEAHFVILNSHDVEIDIIKTKDSGEKDHYRKSWRDTVKEHGGIVPLPLTKKVTGKYHLRVSEHGDVLARIIAKLDREKLKNEYDVDLENKLSRAGTTAHLLQNYQGDEYLIHNARLEDIGIKPISRKLYCEMPVQLEIETNLKMSGLPDVIKIRGHPDALFKFRDGYAVGAIDFKRANHIPYERRSHVRQKLVYARAAAQMLNIEPKYLCGFTTNRPFEADQGNYRNPKYKLVRIPNDKDNAQIQNDTKYSIESYIEQAFVLHSRTAFRDAYDSLHPNEFCRPAADLLADRMKNRNCTLADLIDDMGLKPKDCEYPVIYF